MSENGEGGIDWRKVSWDERPPLPVLQRFFIDLQGDVEGSVLDLKRIEACLEYDPPQLEMALRDIKKVIRRLDRSTG